jgi:hypothetical protein
MPADARLRYIMKHGLKYHKTTEDSNFELPTRGLLVC